MQKQEVSVFGFYFLFWSFTANGNPAFEDRFLHILDMSRERQTLPWIASPLYLFCGLRDPHIRIFYDLPVLFDCFFQHSALYFRYRLNKLLSRCFPPGKYDKCNATDEGACSNYTLKRNKITSPSCTTYSLPSSRISPFSLAAAVDLQSSKSW